MYFSAFEVEEKWQKITYLEYYNLCMKAAKSFIQLGLKPSTCVAIIGFNAPPWMISMYGAIFAGYVLRNILRLFPNFYEFKWNWLWYIYNKFS